MSKNCLIAADIDRTLLTQELDRERLHFVRKVGPALLESARNGAHLAFVTGNSLEELSSRFLTWLSQQLSFSQDVELLPRMHFFSNSAGVYAHFSSRHPAIAEVIQTATDHRMAPEVLAQQLIRALLDETTRTIRPEYIDSFYLERCTIPGNEADTIASILSEATTEYMRLVDENREEYDLSYNLTILSENGQIRQPTLDLRKVTYSHEGSTKQATVQVTLKPLLSWRHARNAERAIGNDPRTITTQWIQKALDKHGLAHYVARPGGRASIDITLEKVDKAYALQFLIDRLNLQGTERLNERFGTNAVYFGDEVLVGGGNDYSITRIPGVLVFAVNHDRDLIPALHQVFVPSAILEGPDATANVLNQFNMVAAAMPFDTTRALRQFKRKLFLERIQDKIGSLSHADLPVEDWQILHAFVALMTRDDEAARGWLNILIAELDSIMVQVGTSGGAALAAYGMSHPDR